MREIREFYNKDSQPTGITYFKGDPMPKGLYSMVVMIAIQNEEDKFLMQKRSPKKGGNWGVTGGHPKAGEDCMQGILSEVKEELGLDMSDHKIEVFNEGWDGHHCYKMYYTRTNYKIEDMTIQEDELSEVRYFSKEELYSMLDNNQLDENQTAFFLKCMEYLKTKGKNEQNKFLIQRRKEKLIGK